MIYISFEISSTAVQLAHAIIVVAIVFVLVIARAKQPVGVSQPASRLLALLLPQVLVRTGGQHLGRAASTAGLGRGSEP